MAQHGACDSMHILVERYYRHCTDYLAHVDESIFECTDMVDCRCRTELLKPYALFIQVSFLTGLSSAM